MQALSRPFGALHVQVDGPETAPPVLFANSLGTDLRLWSRVLPLLPPGLRYIRYDKRGHGLSESGDGSQIDAHADDAIAVIEQVARGPVVFVGISIGGLIGQVVAQRRPDLVRALVLSNTAARLGTEESWRARMAAVTVGGLDSIADSIMERWFTPAFRASPELALWRAMLSRCPVQGYLDACAALGRADQRLATAALRLPTLCLAGEADQAVPSPQVRATAQLIAGAQFRELSAVGHLPPVEDPHGWAACVVPFLDVEARG